MARSNLYAEMVSVFIVVLVMSLVIFAFIDVSWKATQHVMSSSGIISQGGDLFKINEQSIDWGTLSLDQTAIRSVALNAASSDIDYSVTAADWTPAVAEQFMDFSWKVEGGNMTFILHVSPDIENVTSFSFNIVVTGTG